MAIRAQSHERFTRIGYKLLSLSTALAEKQNEADRWTREVDGYKTDD